ncbi:MAG: hypothetical protein ACRDQX_14315 [Pseudonocardiaceae bacterium]
MPGCAAEFARLPVALGLQVVDRDPDSLLSVRLDGHGWAVISPDEQQAVDNALRAALDL